MQTIQVDIEDNKVDAFLTLIDNLKEGMVQNLRVLGNDSIGTELQDYMESTKFQTDKTILQERLADIKSGKTTCVPLEEGLSDLDRFIDELS